ncbi:MAG: hypothetical protein JW384_02048 [Nitrosomonadaceae bacterium]|nr:hypothetical protein [Nitrosomonadaceae bacterium]
MSLTGRVKRAIGGGTPDAKKTPGERMDMNIEKLSRKVLRAAAIDMVNCTPGELKRVTETVVNMVETMQEAYDHMIERHSQLRGHTWSSVNS